MEAELICFFFIGEKREYMRYKNGNPKKCSRFICLHCLQENFVVDGLQRRHQRPNNHIKDIWCANKICSEKYSTTKNLEVRFCDDFEEKMVIARRIRSKYYPTENTNSRKVG